MSEDDTTMSVARLIEILRREQADGAEFVTLSICLPAQRERLHLDRPGSLVIWAGGITAFHDKGNCPGHLMLTARVTSDEVEAGLAADFAIDQARRGVSS